MAKLKKDIINYIKYITLKCVNFNTIIKYCIS